MEKQPLDKTFKKVIKDLQSGVNEATQHLQQGMEEYLNNAIDLPKLLKMIQEMGISGMMGMGTTPIPGMDYYKVLGLDKTSSNAQIKERYRNIVAKLHPDIAGEEMTFITALVNTAYSIICKERGI